MTIDPNRPQRSDLGDRHEIESEKDIDIMRNSIRVARPIYPDQGKIFFGSRAVIDACKPYDWIRNFPKVVQSSPEDKQKVIDKWPELFK